MSQSQRIEWSKDQTYRSFGEFVSRGEHENARNALIYCLGRVSGRPAEEAFFLCNIGTTFADQGDLVKAEEYYEKAIETDPTPISLADYARYLEWYVGDVLRAIEVGRRALDKAESFSDTSQEFDKERFATSLAAEIDEWVNVHGVGR